MPSLRPALLPAALFAGAVAWGAGEEGGADAGLVRIPAGRYTQGCPSAGQARLAGPQPREVELSRDFDLMATELTWQERNQLVGGPGAVPPGCGLRCPATKISWEEALLLANARSRAEGLEPCYSQIGPQRQWVWSLSCPGYRLPTAAEWEYAARGAPAPGCPQGGLASQGGELGEGWAGGSGATGPQPVAQLAPNRLGLYDMIGNVAEWVWDLGPERRSGGPESDPRGPTRGLHRLSCGGSWSLWPPRVGPAVCESLVPPTGRSSTIGLRLARTVPRPEGWGLLPSASP